MNLEEPTEPDVLMLNEPENESDDGNSGQALHRGTATEITTDHSYIYAGGKLLRETITEGSTTKTLDFTYDNVGMPYSLTYNNGTTTATYYYITNLQGDVMYLVDASGNEVAAYDYDPYGKILSATGSMAEVNPLRYRGYYYDSETGFYYLQSRYYDPEICRFINADLPEYTVFAAGTLAGANLFAYCQNNPIAFADFNGEWLNIVIGAVVGALVSAVITIVDAKINGEKIDLLDVAISAGIGAVSGAIAATGLPVLAQAGLTAAAYAAGDVATQCHEIATNRRDNYSFGQTLGAAAMGFSTSIIGSAAGKVVGGNTIAKGEALIAKGQGNTMLGTINKSLGRSHSSLIRSGAKMIAKGTVTRNTGRGIASVVGTIVTVRMNAFWVSITS